MGKLISNYLKIAKTKSMAILDVEFPNNTIMNGVVNQVNSSLAQIKFFNPESIKNAQINTTIDTSYQNETGRGKIDIPVTQQYYYGEGIY